MTYKLEDQNGISIVTPFLSRATLDYAVDFKEYLMNVIEEGKRKIVVDLSLCDFIDSTFLGVLVVALKRVKAIRGELAIVLVSEMPLDMLRQTRMDKVFPLFSTVDDAVEQFPLHVQSVSN